MSILAYWYTHESMIKKNVLEQLYGGKKHSMKKISTMLDCSVHRVEYWLKKYRMPRRSISEAIYRMHHPKGDPFTLCPPKTAEDYILFGIGIGLYWGDGTKANLSAIRLGNTDPELLKTFLNFLVRFFDIKVSDCRFGLQIFTDINPEEALDFWSKKLKIHKRQFYKVTVTRSGSLGTYRRKSQYGVVTIYYQNRKLRDILVHLLHHRSLREVQKEFLKERQE